MIEQQRIDPSHVVLMPAGQAEPLEPTELVDDGVKLGRAPAARFADRLGVGAGLAVQPPFSAPAAARCALIAVLSIISTLAG